MKQSLLPNQERARFVLIMMRIHIVFEALTLALYLYTYQILNQDGPMGSMEIDNYRLALITVFLLPYLSFGLLIVSAIAFVRWMSRGYDNYSMASGSGLFERSSVLWAFFLPFINLARPYNIVQEMWEGMQIRLSQTVKSSLIGWWWTFWIGNFILRLILIGSDKVYIFNILISVFSIIAAFLVIRIVKRYSGFEKERVQYLRIEDLENRENLGEYHSPDF